MRACHECAFFTDLGQCRGANDKRDVNYFQKACSDFEPLETTHQPKEKDMEKEKNTAPVQEEPTTQVCKKCGRELPISEFTRNRYGITAVCKKCRRPNASAYRIGEKPLAVSVEAFGDETLMQELRDRGWKGTLTKQITKEL